MTLLQLIQRTSFLLQATGYAPCPICKVGQLRLAPMTTDATCTNCGTVLS